MTHQEVFTWVLKVLSKDGLVLGGRIGVDASTMEANAALKTIVRRDTGESYRKMLLCMAKESGIDSPTDEDLARMDRKRVGKTLSNKDWQSQVDPEAKITKMKDGRTHLAYKPEHAVVLDTGAVVAVVRLPLVGRKARWNGRSAWSGNSSSRLDWLQRILWNSMKSCAKSVSNRPEPVAIRPSRTS